MTINYYDAGAGAAAVWTRITLICTARGSQKKILTVPTLQHDSALRDYKQNPTRNCGVLFILGLVAEATDSGL